MKRAVTRCTFRLFLAASSEGDTPEEALTNIREAIGLYLEPAEDGSTSMWKSAH